ncbi:phage tail protein [Mangrovibacter phragmitis]|uniref:phage tail protein n=1 Tax=Mangrovibacter phragmitis TaxID=1691903 RepID=UPI0035133376
MTTKQNAVDLARTARSEAASIAKGDKRTIAAIIANWNECVKQAGFMGVFDFPTTGYSRKAQIVADLLRCADQLNDYCEPNPYAPQAPEQQNREFNAALTRVLDAEEAQDEALEINAAHEQQRETMYFGISASEATIGPGSDKKLYVELDGVELSELIEAIDDNTKILNVVGNLEIGEWIRNKDNPDEILNELDRQMMAEYLERKGWKIQWGAQPYNHIRPE